MKEACKNKDHQLGFLGPKFCPRKKHAIGPGRERKTKKNKNRMKNSPKIQKKHSTIPGTGKELLASSDVSRRERIAKKSKATQRPRYVHFVCILVQSIGAPPTRQNKRHGTQGRRVATKYLEHPVKNSCWPLAIPDGHDATGVSFFNGWEIEWSAVLRRLTRV